MEILKRHKEFVLPAAIVVGSLILGGSLIYSSGMKTSERASSAGGGSVSAPSTSPSAGVDVEISPDDHIRGNLDAKVTLVEFSDLECPFCRLFHPSAQQALQEYGDDIRWVYKHFPLDAIHPQARPSAEASECVWEQKGNDGFWQFVDAMFANQESLGSAFYRQVAQSIGVDMSQFDSCVSSRKYQDKVEEDYQLGVRSGVTGTPGSFVNGIPVRGAVPYTQLQSIIEAAL